MLDSGEVCKTFLKLPRRRNVTERVTLNHRSSSTFFGQPDSSIMLAIWNLELSDDGRSIQTVVAFFPRDPKEPHSIV